MVEIDDDFIACFLAAMFFEYRDPNQEVCVKSKSNESSQILRKHPKTGKLVFLSDSEYVYEIIKMMIEAEMEWFKDLLERFIEEYESNLNKEYIRKKEQMKQIMAQYETYIKTLQEKMNDAIGHHRHASFNM